MTRNEIKEKNQLKKKQQIAIKRMRIKLEKKMVPLYFGKEKREEKKKAYWSQTIVSSCACATPLGKKWYEVFNFIAEGRTTPYTPPEWLGYHSLTGVCITCIIHFLFLNNIYNY